MLTDSELEDKTHVNLHILHFGIPFMPFRDYPGNIIRIYHEREGRIEKSAPRITDCHHEACRVMTNGDPEG